MGLTEQTLELLDGQEVMSTHYERVVGVQGRNVIDGGRVIDVLDTDAKVQALFDELFENEFGTSDVAAVLHDEGF